MSKIDNIKARARDIAGRTLAESISPDDVGGLILDLASCLQEAERDGATLGIRKVYSTIEAMRADTTPIDSSGRPIRRGNLVAIYDEATATTDTNSGLVLMWTGEGYTSVARIGTALRHENTALEARISQTEGKATALEGVDAELRSSLEELANATRREVERFEREASEAVARTDAKADEALGRLEYTADEQAKVSRLKVDGEAGDYLGGDGAYHALPASPSYSLSVQEGSGRGTQKVTLHGGTEDSFIEIKSGGGSGGGFLNITREVPIPSGYHYTLEAAVEAVQTLHLQPSERQGLILTFESDAGVWEDYRFTGDAHSDSAFGSVPMWVRYAPEVDTKQIQALIDNSSQKIELAETVDESDRPVSSRAVKAEFDSIKNLTLDSDTEATEGGTKVTLTQEGRIVTEFTVAGGGGGGGAQATRAVVLATLSHKRIKQGDKVGLTYGFTHYVDGEEDGTGASMSLEVRKGITVVANEPLGQVPSGTVLSLDLTRYITSADAYSISVVARYEYNGEQKSRKTTVQLSVVNLSIDLVNVADVESIISSGGYRGDSPANFIVSVRGGAKELTMYLDGREDTKEVRSLTGSGGRQTFSLSPRALSPGSHSLQFVASVDGLKSNSIYVDVLVSGGAQPFVGLLYSRPDGVIVGLGEVPTLLAHQYEGLSWRYIAVGTEAGGVANLVISSPNGTSSIVTPRTYQTYSTRPMRQGIQAWSYELEGIRKAFRVDVVATTLSGIGIKEGAMLELSAEGRSNVEANPAQWDHGNWHTQFEGVDFSSSGWVLSSGVPVLRLINGAKALIGYKPYERDAKTRRLTLTLEARMTNVRRADDAVISCFDTEAEGGFAGFLISPSKVKMPTGGHLEFRDEEGQMIRRDLGLEMPYAHGEFYSLTLVVHPESEERTIRLYINGVLSKADTYQDTIFAQRVPRGILIDSTAADVELRHVRVWETALTDDEILTNYITDRPTLSEMEILRERNDVLSDTTGDISYDKLVSRGKAVLTIVMEGGVEKLWGKSTDTKTNHKFDEIIFRSPFGKAYDLRITDGAMRRQGTSTSTYPVKNLRIYLNRKGFATKVYRNEGKGDEDVWVEVPEKTYVMRPGAKPMKVINLKTDYADSSMCYNTGTAILLNDYLVKHNPALKNKGMKDDPSARMGIDGLPIDVFTSDSAEGDRRYSGQFQLNNDKSGSGYLFGQTKKDGSEIALEFINNMNAIGNFHITGSSVRAQMDSTGADGFDASLEFLYPEKDYVWNSTKPEEVAPEDIKQAVVRLWQWVHDCTPRGVDPSGMTEEEVKRAFVSEQFKREVSQYFDVTNLTMWWVLTDYHLSVDQRVKNTFFRTWGDGIWWLTYYDGDTAFGKRNDAFLAYDYNVNRDTRDLQRNKYAFEGHNSRLWCLVLANLDAELKQSARTLRATLTNEVYKHVFNTLMMGNWSERQYNKSGIYKYIKPTYTDYNGGGVMNYIFALNGNMYAYRNQLIERRFSLLDAKYLVGQYESDVVVCYIGKGNTETSIKVIAADEYYFAWKTQNGKLTAHQGVKAGEVATFSFTGAISQNDPVRLIGASRMRKLDLSTTAPYMQGSWNFNGCKLLEELVAPTSADSPTQWYPMLRGISGLKRIDLTGQRGVTGTEDEQARTFDVSSHVGLEELKLGGTSVRAVRIGAGSPLVRLELPDTLTSLRLRALPKLTMSGIGLASWSSIVSLELAGCPLLDWRTIVDKCQRLERLRIEGVDFEDDGRLLTRLATLKGIDANGSGVDTCELVGVCQLTKYTSEDTVRLWRQHFPSLRIRQPQYTMLEFDDSVADPANISNLDNRTGYKYGTPYEPSAHVARILSERFGCLGKQAERGKMKIYRLHNDNWLKYADHTLQGMATDSAVDMSQGDVYVYEPEYWYKGVNDVLNERKYACYATGERPDSPRVDVITLSELDGMGQRVRGYAVQIGSATSSGALVPRRDYSAYRVRVSGYRRVRCQSIISTEALGAAFYGADDRHISSANIAAGKYNFVDGMYIILDVPEGASWLHFTVRDDVAAATPIVVLSHSLRIEDMEPEWVHHKATLVGAYKGTVVRGKYGSAITVGADNTPVVGSPIERIEEMLSLRGLRPMSYEQYKDIVNLGFAKYGTRDVKRHVGWGWWTNTRQGVMVRSGIHDSVSTPSQGFYEIDGEVRTLRKYDHIYKVLGYEALCGVRSEILGGARTHAAQPRMGLPGGMNAARIVVTRPDGTEEILLSSEAGTHQIQMRLVMGRHLDIWPLSYSSTASEATHYASRSYISGGAAGAPICTAGDPSHDRGLLALGLSRLDVSCARVMYVGEIEEIRDLDQYKSIPMNY